MQRLIQLLDEEIRSRGRGSIRSVDRAAGFGVGWWQHRVKAGDLSVRYLLVVLDHLGLDPIKFMRRALGSENRLELDRAPNEPPPLVARAWHRFQEGEEGHGVGLKWIEMLDEQRYEDPEEAVKIAEWHVDHVELALLPKFLGVVGSAFRLMLSLGDAEHALQAGARIAEAQNDLSAVGNLLQRLAYVAADRGEYLEALHLSERAMIRFLRSGDSLNGATSIVDQGVWLSRQGQPAAAVETMKLALKALPRSECKNLCTAFQVIALNLQRMGALSDALEYLSRAEKEAKHLGNWADGKLMWLRARIFTGLGDLDEALRLYERVIEIFWDKHYGETALATCEKVRVQILRGCHLEAFATAVSMRRLVEPLHPNKVISASIADLLRSGQEGLTLALVEHIERQIKSERDSLQRWNLLKVPSEGPF